MTCDALLDAFVYGSLISCMPCQIGATLSDPIGVRIYSIANSSISRDAAGNCKLDRATQRGRIDTLQAGVLALGLGIERCRRWF